MTSLRTALLAAAALAIAPTMAHAEEQNPRHEHGDYRGGGGDRGARPAPPQAPQSLRGPVLFGGAPPSQPANAGAPRGNWGGGQPMVQTPPQRTDRGPWPGGGQWRGDRGPGNPGQWQGGRGGTRPTPPQGANAGQNWQNRGDWNRGDNRGDRGGDRRGDDRRGGDHRWDGGDRSRWDNGNRGPWPDRGRWDNRNRQNWNGGDYRGTWRENGGRWDANRWRNDHRYDWRNWRSSHGDLFRGRYYAPRGFQYRPVYRGFYLEPFFYGSSYWLADPFEYRLPPVEWPLRWVRYYDDALLVDVTTGEVVDVIQDFFW